MYSIYSSNTQPNHLFFSYSEESFTVNQRLVPFTLGEGQDVELIAAILNSVVTILTIEMRGTSRNLGALDLNADYFKTLKVLNPNILSKKAKESIKTAFQSLKNRPVREILDEIGLEDRQEFDHVVIRSFGVDEEMLPRLYQLLASAVSNRVNMRDR